MSKSFIITAIIPTLSNTKGLKKVLSRLSSCSIPTIIIDNHPTTEKEQLVTKHKADYFPQVQNTGFAIAVNLGATRAATHWLLILNDDIEFPSKKIISNLLTFAKKNKLTAVSPILAKPSGKIENYGYTVSAKGKVDLNFDPDNKDLDGITAACLVIRKDIFTKLGGFDERFFAYLEDVDLFLRLKRAGYKFAIDYNTKVIHNHMSTTRKLGNFKQKMDFRNWFFLIYKHWTFKKIILNFPSIFLERLRNLSGYLKATIKSEGIKSVFIIPADLVLISWQILTFPFRKPNK